MFQILFKPLSKDEALRHEHVRSRPQSSVKQKTNMLFVFVLNDYKSGSMFSASMASSPQEKDVMPKQGNASQHFWFYFKSHFLMQLDTGCSSPAIFRGFVFISSWVWPPAAARCLSHEASNLLQMRVMRWTWQTCSKQHTVDGFLTNGSLDFAHDLIIWDRLPTFIVGDDLRLLADFL